MMTNAIAGRRPLLARIAAQGAVLLGGFGLSQLMSLMRNALIGHALSRGDFGVAASITMLLQVVDSLSELGTERLVVQADDGGDNHFIGTAHAVTAARGLATGLLIMLTAGAVANFFAVPEAAWAFAAAGLTPMLRGFMHLDVRRAQRRLDNRSTMLVEMLPQAVALAATPIVLAFERSYSAVLWLALLQALTAVIASHVLATTRYALAVDGDILRRLVRFGWPIWLSGIPLIAVYQGDRILVGRFYGMETLAAFSAAFMVAMVPGLLAGKIGNALMLPLFADATDERDLERRYRLISEATALAAAAYLVLFILLGDHVMRLAFGAQYAGLGPLVSWLAVMWAVRMMQAVPGMALMAEGVTRPLLIAGVVRSLALPVAVLAAWMGFGLETVVAIGVVGELASLIYVGGCVESRQRGLGTILVLRTGLIVPFGFLATALKALLPGAGLVSATAVAGIVLALIGAGGIAVLPGLRRMMASLWPQAEAA